MKDEDGIENSSQKNNFRVILLSIVYLIALVFAFIVMLNFGVDPFIIIILLAFISLLILGSILKRRKQKSLYSKLYPDKKQITIQRPTRKLELTIKEEQEAPIDKKFREVNLNFKYRKSLINKCENCGMIITSHKKKCPICGKALELKGIIMKCKKCGMTIPKSVKKCPVCGTRVS
ncbi:MAG: zinc ribbon domain-containing protein [Candidatus Lokiarchaeota archaeon]|nr:zinc ribbon domain-containing protein [Candidatus Lokiarchaeota archaeon]